MGASRSEEARRSNRIARGGGDDDDGDDDDDDDGDDRDDDDDSDDDDDWLRLMEDGWSAVVDADETCVLIGARCPLQDLFMFAYVVVAQSSLTINLTNVKFQ